MAAADRTGATDKQLARLAMARGGNLMFGFGDYDGALQIAAAAEAAIADPVWRDRVAAHRARFEYMSGHPAEALATAERLLEADDPRAWLDAGLLAVVSLTIVGRTGEAVATADRVANRLRQAGVHPANAAALTVPKVLALVHAGRLDEAETLADASYRNAVEFGAIDGQGWFSLSLGRVALYRGDLPAAIEWFTKSMLLWADQPRTAVTTLVPVRAGAGPRRPRRC